MRLLAAVLLLLLVVIPAVADDTDTPGISHYVGGDVVNLHAHRVAHADPHTVIVTDPTITGGDMLYYRLSLAEIRVASPNTGSFAKFATVEVPVNLTAGTHTLRLNPLR